MKRLILSLSIGVIAFSGASAAPDPRVDVARLAEEQNRTFRGDAEFRADKDWRQWEQRSAFEIDRLNREVRQLRYDIRVSGAGSRIRHRFEQIVRDTDRLTALYRQHRIRNWDLHHRAEEIRSDVVNLRRALPHRR